MKNKFALQVFSPKRGIISNLLVCSGLMKRNQFSHEIFHSNVRHLVIIFVWDLIHEQARSRLVVPKLNIFAVVLILVVLPVRIITVITIVLLVGICCILLIIVGDRC